MSFECIHAGLQALHLKDHHLHLTSHSLSDWAARQTCRPYSPGLPTEIMACLFMGCPWWEYPFASGASSGEGTCL